MQNGYQQDGYHFSSRDICRLTHSICTLLQYTYHMEKKCCNSDRSQWLNEKFKLGLDCLNLPYITDWAYKITCNKATLDYMDGKHSRKDSEDIAEELGYGNSSTPGQCTKH